MRTFFLLVAFFQCTVFFAQKDCEYSSNITDSLGTYKSTKEFLMHEKIFGGAEKLIFFTLNKSDEVPSLSVQLIQKSADFIPALCFDKNSKVFVQLENGKIITLFSINESDCGSSVMVDNKNCRILTGYFLFMKDSIEDLKSSPISLLRIQFASGTVDYIVKNELISELDKLLYHPSNYFIDYLKCVD